MKIAREELEKQHKGLRVLMCRWVTGHILEEPSPPPPITLDNSPVATVDSFRFLGTTISRDLKWELNISSLIKKAQQRMFFLRQLKKFNLPRTMMLQSGTRLDCGGSYALPIGCDLPSLQALHDSRTLKRARKIMADPSHPGHGTLLTAPLRQEAAVDKN
ncbi:hypothetical protein SKAU_G00310810 [Synaphobranchus kaupii]|uniref:Alkylated DNA repair protein AlkB homologue 8 N-terminal domain-containing protein n=1 Tax=Synaphobranchus kaupii TaxID=118154 RepID=A0A9Q1IL82_SYNKA|nr:hypothetical protein SKAU_G00310810 [Synaphobranchus kaupii]